MASSSLSGFPGGAKKSQISLADFANDEGYCWPSLERLSKKYGISLSTLKSQLANLCNDGFIRKELHKKVTASGELTNDTNVYWIMLNKLGGSESDLGRNSSKGRPKSAPKPSIAPSDLIDPLVVPQTAVQQNRKKNHKVVSMPEDFAIQATWRSGTPNNPSSRWTWAAIAQWRGAMLSKQRKYVDWPAAWRNGMRNDNEALTINTIIGNRTADGLPTGVLTNLNYSEFVKQLGDRVIDRLKTNQVYWVEFNWPSYRSKA